MRRLHPLAIPVVLLTARLAAAQSALPEVDDVEWPALRSEVEGVLKGLKALKAPLPDETARGLEALLAGKPDDERAAAREAQRLLDAHCLLGVSINPESRVKAARGPARAELTRDRPGYVLVKVHNDGGVTHALSVDGDHLIQGKPGVGRWLEAEVMDQVPLARKLHGRRVQYVVLKLTAREAGKREATLRFDVGQGTQDLGFRAEVPVLFTVRTP
jgi:hypothetical protein